ncbi:MAG: protease modulator HflK N-terminal domain-containing protein, partial [Gammaproteobacteria bacterium]|nr:protease modulator HflK N-terminal domain-containing protein [Gammaproteobacteria bacterium]
MAWNEPGKGRDPWGGNGQQRPPDLDEMVRKMQARLNALFGGGGGGGKRGGGGAGSSLTIIGAIAVIALIALSAYRIDAPEQGIVLRLGEYHKTSAPGLHFRIPFVDTVEKINTSEIGTFDYKNQMLTSDENFVYVETNVQFRRSDPV